MRSGANARGRVVRVSVTAILLFTALIPSVRAAEPVGATVQVSWTRPGVAGTMTAPAKLRVGDTVTIQVSPTGFTQAACDMLFHHLGSGAQMGATQTGEATLHGAAYCRPWTFVVPPAPAGTVNVHVSVSGDDSVGDDAYARPADIPLTLEAGGARRPYTSTYPTPSWAPIDFLGTASPSLGAPLVVAQPPGATRACSYAFSGDWNASLYVSSLDASCSDWHVTLADFRPDAVTDQPDAPAWEAWISLGGATEDPDTGAGLAGYAGTAALAMQGDGSDTLATNLPAVHFPDATNPRYVPVGSTVHVRPQVHAVTDPAAVCRISYGDAEDFTEVFAPVADGTCGSVSFVVSETGSTGVSIQLHSGDVAASHSGYEVWAVESMPTPTLTVDSPVAGTPFSVSSSLTAGLPSAYEFSLSGSGFSSNDRRVAAGDAFVAATNSCSSGVLDFLDQERSATGTCTAPAAGTYTVAVRFTDVTGATKTRSRSITVADPSGGVIDIIGHKFEDDIRWLYTTGITSGCAPNRFCPDGLVTRAQMATFLSRALSLPATSKDYFTDDESSKHEGAINRLRAADITYGCSATKFCPNGLVTRAQMASFLARAFDLRAASRDYFTDDEGNRHEDRINRLRAAAITYGCSATRYCPDGVVTRGQMAAFLHRARD